MSCGRSGRTWLSDAGGIVTSRALCGASVVGKLETESSSGGMMCGSWLWELSSARGGGCSTGKAVHAGVGFATVGASSGLFSCSYVVGVD